MSIPGNAFLRLMAGAVVVLGLAACQSRYDTHGNLPDPDRVAQLTVGQDTRERVEELLGSPSSVNVFDKEAWYYISEETETFAFFEPKVKKRKVLVLRFDKQGVLSDIKTLGLEQANLVEPVDRVTPAMGKEEDMFDYFFGGLKRIANQGQQN